MNTHLLELEDPLHHLPVLVCAQVVIVKAVVPRVEGMVADAVQSLLWEPSVVVPQNLIHVLVMTEGHMDLL